MPRAAPNVQNGARTGEILEQLCQQAFLQTISAAAVAGGPLLIAFGHRRIIKWVHGSSFSRGRFFSITGQTPKNVTLPARSFNVRAATMLNRTPTRARLSQSSHKIADASRAAYNRRLSANQAP